MNPLPGLEVTIGLGALFFLTLPLGSVLLLWTERFVGRTFPLTTPERLIVSFYATGGFLFVLASVPLPLYTTTTVFGLIVVGFALRIAMSIRQRGRDLAGIWSFLRRPVTWALLVLTVGILVLEVVTTASFAAGNTVDGSVYSLFVQLIERNHTLPWTLMPYASTGVTYPQGASVWMTIPGLLFGWPVVSLPVVVPPLFLALSVPAAFCLGQRLPGYSERTSALGGLLFAGFFALIASWPRLFVNGSFDFLFSLPLFLIVLGWLYPIAVTRYLSWRVVLCMGALLGVAASLSASTGMTLLLLVVVFLLSFPGPLMRTLRTRGLKILAIVCVSCLFLVRSIVGIAIWFNYPGHDLGAVGRAPYASYGFPSLLTYGTFQGELDPFVLWKPKLSPFPLASLSLAVLLTLGLFLLVMSFVRTRFPSAPKLLPSTRRTIAVTTATVFAETLTVLLLSGVNTSAAGIQSITNLNELSILLFICYEIVALIPMMWALDQLATRARARPMVVSVASSRSHRQGVSEFVPVSSLPYHFRRDRALVVGAVLVLLVPFSLGMGLTVQEVPSYLHDHMAEFANLTAGDYSVLEWAGTHLPPCSRVLVAPGSAAQYLPEFADVQMVFPVYPPTVNSSYYLAVAALITGAYLNSTRSALLQINVTEVFVTGQSTISYEPFQLAPLVASPDFLVLDAQQDAAILAFQPGVVNTGCGA